ncbi:MAG TPA: GAF domain-containing protein, partial [Kutzneria sp.]
MSDLERLARLVAHQREQLAQLRARAAADAVLEQAKGRLVERVGGSLARATEHLHTLADSVGLTPLEMAAELMETAPPPPGGDIPVLGLRLAETRVSTARDGDALADAVFTEALLPTGAVALAIWRMEPDGTLRLVGQRGLGSAEASRWRQLPPQFAANARTAVVEQRQLWLRAGVSDPTLAPAADRWPGGARAVLPIRNSRAVLGAMEICWPVPRREFTAGQRTELAALADLCASALSDVDGEQSWLLGLLDSLVDAVLTARAERVDGEVVDIDTVPRDDPATFELVQSAKTLGMFQIESPGQRELVGKFAPETFNDIIIDISLFRPGPVKTNMVPAFLESRWGFKQPDFLHEDLRFALAETFGVVVFHEQVLHIIATMTGCSLSEADEVRRALSDPEGIARMRSWFRPLAARRGYPVDVIGKAWEVLEGFAA